MIALLNPWSTPSAKKPLPMSLLALASQLDGAFDYEIVDGNLVDDPVARLLDLDRSRRLTAIGITVMPGPQLPRALDLSRKLKVLLPGVPIVWGGYFPSQHADTCLRDPSVDVVVRGQGEMTFAELVRAIARGGALSDIAGLSFKDAGAIRHTARRPLTPLDELPDWPYARVAMPRYLHAHYLGRRVGTHHSSFGCPFACNFCAVVEMSHQRWVAQSAARVAAILEAQQREYGIDAVQFHDMDFFISEPRVAELADRITGRGLAWWALGRVDELMRYREATWRRMRRSGLRMVFCGAESGSDAVLARMNKGGAATAEKTLALARRMREHGVVPEFSFVVGNPPDPEADVRATTTFVRRLKAINPDAEIILYTYSPVPLDGTLYDTARAMGFRFPETLDEWTHDDWRHFALRRDPRTPWLRRGWRSAVRDFESVLNAYYPTVTDARLTPLRRALLKTLSGWRYWLRVYGWPVELRAFHAVFGYQRPETTGF